MEKVLYKKSYQLNSFAPKRYDDLLGKRGIFSTIRVLGKKPKFILIDYHIKNMNIALKKCFILFLFDLYVWARVPPFGTPLALFLSNSCV